MVRPVQDTPFSRLVDAGLERARRERAAAFHRFFLGRVRGVAGPIG